MIPSTVFIIPYRDRVPHRIAFIEAMNTILMHWNKNSYKFMFIHQCDNRPFNRGAMKNIGFLTVKNLYPSNYQDITLIFNDIDTWPGKEGLIEYTTIPGVVRHFYGFEHTLGGILAIKGADFEKCNGFPNLWGWGLEDNTLQDRCLLVGLTIDRSNFYKIADPRIMMMYDGMNRVVSIYEPNLYKQGKLDGLMDINDINYNIVDDMINVTSFNTLYSSEEQIYEERHLKNLSKLPILKNSTRKRWNMY